MVCYRILMTNSDNYKMLAVMGLFLLICVVFYIFLILKCAHLLDLSHLWLIISIFCPHFDHTNLRSREILLMGLAITSQNINIFQFCKRFWNHKELFFKYQQKSNLFKIWTWPPPQKKKNTLTKLILVNSCAMK